MKFTWFNLMPWPFLPDDFRKRHRSVWVDIPSTLYGSVGGAALLTGGVDFSNLEALKEFYVGNAKRLGQAGKILFPIPNRRLSKRLYRLAAPALLVWGRSDRLIEPAYAERWQERLPAARVEWIDEAGHMLPYEQPDAFADAVTRFLG